MGVLVTVVVVGFVAREFDWHAVQATLSQADLRYLALAMAAMLLNIALKTRRWQWLLHPQSGHVRWRDLLCALLVGQLGNVLLPTRLGDVMRMGVAHKMVEVPLSWALVTIVAEKALDSVMLILLLGVLLPSVAWPAWVGTTQVIYTAVLAGGLVLVSWLATQGRVRQRVVQTLRRMRLGPIPGWTERILQSLGAWQAVRETPLQVRLWAWSVAIWFLAGLVNYFGFRAVALQVPFTAGLLLAATEVAGTRLAYTPAAIGVYHSIAILTLALFGVEAAAALSAALLLHVVVYLPILIGGLAGVWLAGVDLKLAATDMEGVQDEGTG